MSVKEKTVTGYKSLKKEKSVTQKISVREKSMITWDLDANGSLTVEGNGAIPDACCGHCPVPAWEEVKDKIREVYIMEGIESIGLNAFRGCRNLTKVVLSYTVSRINAYAFQDCIALEEVATERSEFRMLGDPGVDDPEDTVIFSLESFRRTPWIRKQFGEFYIQNRELYAVFAVDGEDVVIPAHVRVLRPYCLSHLNLKSLLLPAGIKYIGNFAFQGTRVGGITDFPASSVILDEYSLADCGICWQGSETLLNQLPERAKSDQMSRFPSVFQTCTIAVSHRKVYGGYERLFVKQMQISDPLDSAESLNSSSALDSSDILMRSEVSDARYQQNTPLTSRIIDTSIEVGNSIYRRIRHGSVLICVKYNEKRVLWVESFTWNKENELVNEYLLYPVWESDIENFGCLVPWRDSFTWQEKDDIISAFYGCSDGRLLAESGSLRLPDQDCREEWFRSSDARNFGGKLEIDFLKIWLKQHPGIHVDTREENTEHDKTRWFVPV